VLAADGFASEKTTGWRYTGNMIPYSLYLHFPFCQTRCSYCDFNTYAGQGALIPAYMEALGAEARILATGLDETIPVHTIFFGGGTPSLLPPELLQTFLECLSPSYTLSPDLEFTLEANPGTLSQDNLISLLALGVNRLSLGMQSAHPDELALLGRRHDFQDVTQAVCMVRQTGFQNLNLDLIYDLPGQTLERWRESLTRALALEPDHFSLYSLTIEEGTPLHDLDNRGLLDSQDPDRAADMYEAAAGILEEAGYRQYEISNWAKPGRECRHNLQYWRNLPYLGLGAGAHGYVPGFRTANVRGLGEYIRRMKEETGTQASVFPRTPATQDLVSIDPQTEMGETMMMGLRLTLEGVSDGQFQTRFGCSLRSRFGQEIATLEEQGLLEWNNDRLRLTPRGRLLGNQVFQYFI
jgi:oxygen-independent coproporphyrinogen-3 oxidase